ncbi:MAG TPA: hypothetical protein VIJ72_01850, partial [Rhizomicrobium sp.]
PASIMCIAHDAREGDPGIYHSRGVDAWVPFPRCAPLAGNDKSFYLHPGNRNERPVPRRENLFSPARAGHCARIRGCGLSRRHSRALSCADEKDI